MTYVRLLLNQINRPTLDDHVGRFGPLEWEKTGRMLHSHNSMLSKSFLAMAKIQRMQEENRNSWSTAAIMGHSNSSILFPFTRRDADILHTKGFITVSQLFRGNENCTIRKEIRNDIDNLLSGHVLLLHKMKLLHASFKNRHTADKVYTLRTATCELVHAHINVSIIYRKLWKERKEAEIKTPPAYLTRMNDRKDVVALEKFKEAYKVIYHKLLSSKTKENSFQTLNRTIWTNNKAFKSGIAESDGCPYCEETETMEHLYYACEKYSELQWIGIAAIIS